MKHFSRKLTALLLAMVCMGGVQAGELTVAEGTATSDKLPFNCYYGDVAGVHNQVIFPANYLEELNGASITALTFYVSKLATKELTAIYTVGLAEVEEAAFASAAYNTATLTSVFEGSIDARQATLTVTFSEPFVYAGGNLLLDINTQAKGSYADVEFAGVNSGASTGLFYTTYGANIVAFLPKTTFVFEDSGATCPRPSKLTSEVTADGAVFAWQAEEGAKHQVRVVEKDASAAGWQLLDANVLTFTATGLTTGTAYDFYVRTYCSETEQSAEVKTSFTPECKAPAKVEVSDLTHAAATLSWDAVAGIDKYQFVCVRKDSTPEWDGVEAKAVLSVTVDTLKASTAYDFYVRSYFSETVQSAATKLTFTTNCVAAEIPYEEIFASTNKPSCWTAANWGTSANYWSIDTYEDHSGDGSYSLKYNARTSSSSEITTVSIDLAEDALLDFFYQNRVQSTAIQFDIIVLDASNEAELLTESVTTASQSGKWEQKTIDLSALTGKTVKVKFRGHGYSSTQGYLRIDDLSITAKPCTTPTNLKAAASTTGAVVTWTAGGSEAAWNLRHKAVSAEEWTLVNALDEPTYTIGECSPETEYEVQVQAACNGDKQSPWTASATFTPVCPVPTKLAVKEIEDDRALVVWECTESVFHLQFKQADAEDWTTVDSVKAKTYELTDLTAVTTYQVRVQTACGSAFTNAVSFTTRCAPLADTIPYVLHMDSVAIGPLPECWFVLPKTAEAEVALMNDSTHRLLVSGEQECWVVMPALNAVLNGLTVSVTWSGTAWSEIGYMTTADEETFVPLGTFGTMPAECDLRNASAEAKYIAFHYVGTSDYSIGYIAQVQLAETTGQTAIGNTQLRTETTKCLEDGRLVIISNGVRYNAQGTVIK